MSGLACPQGRDRFIPADARKGCWANGLKMHETLIRELAFLALLARLGLSAVFLRAGITKILTLASFQAAVAGYRLLPRRLVPVVSRTLPIVEISAGSLLAGGLAVRLVAPMTGLLLVTFAAAMALNLSQGRVVDCGCAGNVSQPITWRHVVQDLILAALAIWVAIEAPFAIWSRAARADILPALLILVAGAVAGSLAMHGWRAMRAVRP